MGYAVLVVDMISDFVDGRFGSQHALDIIPALKDLLKTARAHGIPVIYLCDSHYEGDPELEVWGQHAMKDTEGSVIMKEIEPGPDDIIIKKHVYSGFYNSELEDRLKNLEIDKLIVAGVSTDICVQHNVADAFFRGLRSYVVTDATAAINPNTHESAIDYMVRIYGAKPIKSEDAKALMAKGS